MILEVLSSLTDFYVKKKKLNFLRLLLLQMCIMWQVVLIRNKLDLNIIIRSLSGFLCMTVSIIKGNL